MKSGFFVFPRHAKNGKTLPFEVEQKVEIKGGAIISTELESFSLICNVLRRKKGHYKIFCANGRHMIQTKQKCTPNRSTKYFIRLII